MSEMLIARIIAASVLFGAWIFIEYYPPPGTDTDKIKNFIQSALMALAGNTLGQVNA